MNKVLKYQGPADVLRDQGVHGVPSQTGEPIATVETVEGLVGYGWLNPSWRAAVRTVRDERTGARRVVELVLRAQDEQDGPELTTSDLREVSLRRFIDDTRLHAAEVGDLLSDEAEAYLPELRQRWSGNARGRTTARPRVDYAILAAVYARRVEQGDRRPVAYIAEVVGQSTVTVTQRVREARAMGLLTPVAPGKAGGRLTPQAEALLKALLTDGLDDEQEG